MKDADGLFGYDLFGEPVRSKRRGVVAERFVFPPFTVLSARDGDWKKRKQAWLSMGIRSEVGRDVEVYGKEGQWGEWMVEKMGGQRMAGGSSEGDEPKQEVSVFDPVLCELAYRWWCPDGGQVVDPFAGGSVRGVVAGHLGYRYWGCELRSEQVEANRVQGEELIRKQTRVRVHVSGKMLRQLFHPCEAGYISDVCGSRCCESTVSEDGISVAVHPSEQDRIESLGATVVDGYIKADERRLCPFKSDEGLCTVHEDKPFGCKASPFTFNDKGLLIVRNRYRRFKCYKDENAVPAYDAHRWSLEQIFGKDEAARIADRAAGGEDRIEAWMPADVARIIRDNHWLRNGSDAAIDDARVRWVCGDSMREVEHAPDADFIFSCPPYGDLEKYSDDPRDISSMTYEQFLIFYRGIIRQCVDRLKPDRFACFVVGEFRAKDGSFRNFVGDTIAAFEDAGAKYYNDAVILTPIGSACLRATRQFNGGRKLIKVHQRILVFVKGDWKRASNAVQTGGDQEELDLGTVPTPILSVDDVVALSAANPDATPAELASETDQPENEIKATIDAYGQTDTTDEFGSDWRLI